MQIIIYLLSGIINLLLLVFAENMNPEIFVEIVLDFPVFVRRSLFNWESRRFLKERLTIAAFY